MCTITLNNELKGIELSFASKPTAEILTAIKNAGFRWHNIKKIWYAKQNEKTLNFANSIEQLENGTTETQQETKAMINTKKDNTNKNILSLWEATRWNEETSNVNEKLTNKEIAVEARKHLKARFSYCKFSITTSSNSIYCEILESPFEKESIYLKAIAYYCYNYINSFKYCTCYDPYGDYGSSYNFYGVYENNIIKYDYKQTEQTTEIKAQIEDYNKQLKIFEQQEEEKQEQQYKIWEAEQAEKEKEYQAREAQRQINITSIKNNVSIKELTEQEQYFVIGSQFARLNKNDTLERYKQEVEAGEFYLQDLKITKEFHFTKNDLLLFENMLLDDFTFISGTGGSYTDDNRINSMTDYYQMTEEERKTVKLICSNSIAVYCENVLQFVIDAQGYDYARYVGLVDNITIVKSYKQDQILQGEELETYKNLADTLEDISTQIIESNNINDIWNNESWNLYKEQLKEQLKAFNIKLHKNIIQQITIEDLKVAMYKLLIEVDSIQEQFKVADLQQNQKITIFKINDFGMMSTSHLIVDSFENSTYAQYKDVVKLTFKQKSKKGLYYKHYYKDMLIYNDWLELPQNVLYDVKEQDGFICTSTKFLSCDNNQYDEIINYFLNNNIKPIINTYKPIF